MNPIAIGLVFAARGAAQEIDDTRKSLEACLPSGWRIDSSSRNPTAYVIWAHSPVDFFHKLFISVSPTHDVVAVTNFPNGFKNLAVCNYHRSTKADEAERKVQDAKFEQRWESEARFQQFAASMGPAAPRPDAEGMRLVRTTANKLREAVLDKRKTASPR